jgi:hypothetical protein
MGASGDSQSILREVSELRQKYDECRASQGEIKGIDPKVLAESRDKNQKLAVEINQKNGVIKSLEQTMLLRDRSYRETNARNKNLIAQLHTQNVTGQEREMLKRALISVKGELALAQKELRGGSSSIVRMREELQATKSTLAKLQSQPQKVTTHEKIVTKVVEPTDKILALQSQLNAANMVITQLRSAPQKTQVQQPQVVYQDRVVTQEKVVYKDRIVTKEKVVYKDRPVEKIVTKTVEPTAKIQALTRELASAKATIADLQKNGSKVIYKDRVVTHELVVYKDRPVEKIVTKKVIVEKPTIDETTRRKMDKLALDLERQKSINLKLAKDLEKTSVKRSISGALPPPLINPLPHTTAKTISAPAVKKVASAAAIPSNNAKKSAGVYRMASNASIYNGPNGRVIDTWEARRSFTGSGASDGWIHITGYFVNRVFQGTGEGEDLWVKESDAIRR